MGTSNHAIASFISEVKAFCLNPLLQMAAFFCTPFPAHFENVCEVCFEPKGE